MIKSKKNIMFVASEAQPFAVSGGLGDVIGSLPKALAASGKYDVRVVLPLYSTIPEELRKKFKYVGNTNVAMSWRRQYLGLFEYVADKVTYYFLDNEYYFKRSGLYGYFDDAERFTYLCRGALDIIPMINFIPSIIHCHDWQTALIPVYLKTLYAKSEVYKNIRTVFTIHNMEYQGKFGENNLYDLFELPETAKSLVEYENDVNLMKGAIQCADIVSTVSPTYADEILLPEAAKGLNYITVRNAYKIRGILNGIDVKFYNPSTDDKIFTKYGIESLDKKRENKIALQKMLGLPLSDAPIVTMITRLVSHKGIDLVQSALPELMKKGVQLVVLGTGDNNYEQFFKEAERNYGDKVRALIEFNSALSRKIYAGGDIFLMPSKTEPCGLSQMIACRYGNIPVVRKVGGLNDSIVDVGDNGFGYTFVDYNSYYMTEAINRAINAYYDKTQWNNIVSKAMSQDFSWKKSAAKYSDMYKELLSGKM